MILRFLMLFPAFRESVESRNQAWQNAANLGNELSRLREALRDAQTERVLLQDRLDAAISERQTLWEMTRECINNERASYQAAINQQWQRQGFGAPYPDAYRIPDAATQQSGGPGGRQQPVFPSTLQAQRTSEFLNDYVKNPQ